MKLSILRKSRGGCTNKSLLVSCNQKKLIAERVGEPHLKRGRQFVVSFSALFLTLFLSANQPAEAQTFLADQHTSKGMVCSSCHQGANQKDVETKTCQSCHGDYDKLVKLTDKLEINPHESHLGEPDCKDCHHGHKQSSPACKQCHDFSIPMKY